MPEQLKQWYRRRRFIVAYRILRNEGERHRAAGHDCEFNATSESYIHLECLDCPWQAAPLEDEDLADRVEYVLRITEVSHIGKPHGPGRENPPHLWDFRRFVEACEGLPDSMVVDIKQGVSEARDSGRHDMTFSVTLKEPVTDEMVEERASKLDWFKRVTTKSEDDDTQKN